MEGGVEAADDQGSGWFEVRKKHRSSSKHSTQSLGTTGGLSGKYTSANQQPSLSKKHRTLQGNDRPWCQDKEVKASMHGRSDITNVTTTSINSGLGLCLPQNLGVQQRSEDNACSGSSHLAIATSIVGDTTASACNSPSPMSVPKIKWGDLDDNDLVQHCESDFQLDLRSSEAQDSSSKDKFHEDHSLVLQESSSTNLQGKEQAVTSLDVQTRPGDKLLHNVEDLRHDIHKVDEVSRKNVQVLTTNKNVIALDSVSCNNGYKEYRESMNNDPDHSADGEKGASLKLQIHISGVNVSNVSDVNSGSEKSDVLETVVLEKVSETDSSEQAGTGCNSQFPVIAVGDEMLAKELPISCVNQDKATIFMDGESLPAGPNNVKNSGKAVSEVEDSEIDNDEKGNSSKVVMSHDIASSPSEDCGILIENKDTESVSSPGYPGDETRQDKHLRVQSSISPEEGTTGESKERFRERLWCFLFENLNRSVDELYLLCELECDMEQMKEAILVLEEAASDFQELTKRVLGFEHVKRFTSKSIDGSPVTLRSDHRRPHALSWEVRRMTTSPHKAEILSSSLEAFKKIQQERAKKFAADNSNLEFQVSNHSGESSGNQKSSAAKYDGTSPSGDSTSKTRKQSDGFDNRMDPSCEKRKVDLGKSNNRVNFIQDVHGHQNNSSSGLNSLRPFRDNSLAYGVGKSKRECEDKPLNQREKYPTDSTTERNFKSADHLRKPTPLVEKDREKKMSASWKSMNAWKEKRNWEDILSSPFRVSSRISHSPGMSRKSGERVRVLHDKLMSPEKKKKTALDLKKEAEEKHARAMRIRSELETERVQKLQRTSEKLNRVTEWQAVRTMKLREGMYARHQRNESRHEAFIAQVVKRAGDESSKVSEVRFITSLNEENKKLMLRQKLQDSELRRAEKLQILKTKQKEDMAREEAVLERRKLLEAEKLQRLAETQRKKEEAQLRREEERKASSAAREARAIEQLRRREERAKAQQEEAELLAQKLAERLSESEQRRKFYLEQIRERAAMDFRDQSSPLLRRSGNKEGQGRSTPTKNGEDHQENGVAETGASTLSTGIVTLQHSLKRRIKKIRQRLMALKYDFPEPPAGLEAAGIGYRTAVGTARVKIGRWLQELQRLRQARKEGAASIGLITADIIKFLEGKDAELQAARQAGLLDFIASALPASHTSKPEDCRVTLHFLKLLRVVLSAPANRSYFLAQNLLPPIVPMLSSALENYIKIAASIYAPAGSNLPPTKTSIEHFETISEVLDSFLFAVGMIMGHTHSNEKELQMRDGLLELLIAYQVIHRLRDLFALYDRPQVEGSPFPSSILLSIQLLVVLTSRSLTTYTIDWDSLPEATPGIESHKIKPNEIAESTEDCGSEHSVLKNGVIVPSTEVSDDRTLDESCTMKSMDELLSMSKDSEKPAPMEVQLDLTNREGPIVSQKSLIQNEQNLIHKTEKQDSNRSDLKQSESFLFSAMSETGLVCLPSLLTAVLLQANNRLSSELGTYILPANFEEVATGVLKVLNNLALMNMTFIQRMLARPDLKMEFFHLMSFLLSHCTSKWKTAGDQVGLLLLESLSLLGYFSLFHQENQAVLRWGKSPTILHKVCDLPFVFFSDSALMPVLASTLVAACYGCEQNKVVVLQELSMDMLHSLLKSCRNVLPDNPVAEISLQDDPLESNQQGSELRRSLGDTVLRPIRYNSRSTRLSLGKGSALGNAIRGGKIRSQRDLKATKASEEMVQKQKLSAPRRPVRLHCRFPSQFIDRVEQFFSPKFTQVGSEV